MSTISAATPPTKPITKSFQQPTLFYSTDLKSVRLSSTPQGINQLIQVINSLNQKVRSIELPLRSGRQGSPIGLTLDAKERGDLFNALKKKGITNMTISSQTKSITAWEALQSSFVL